MRKITNLEENTFEAFMRNVYDGNEYEWVNEVIDLSDFLGMKF